MQRRWLIPTTLCLTMATAGCSLTSATSGGKTEGATPGFNNKIPSSILTPDRVDTSIGTLNFFDGMPDDETVQRTYDNLDRMRGVEAFLNFVPMASLEGLRRGQASLGLTEPNQVLLFSNLMDSNSLFLTGNTDTVYASAMLDLRKHGPIVVEVPPGAGPGTVNDAFFRFVIDMGKPGPDRGQGGKYLILPPDFEGEAPEGYFVGRSSTWQNWLILRGLLVGGETGPPDAMWRNGLAVYPLSRADDPPKMEFVDGSGKEFNTIHANDFTFFEEIDEVIQREPIDAVDPEIRGDLASIGIQKGQKFAPDQRTKALLTDAVAIGNATARSLSFRPRSESIRIFGPDSAWYTAFDGGSYEWLIDDGKGGRNKDARTLFFYLATVNTPAMVLAIPGVGSQYALASTDSEGRYLDGSKNYKLVIPADVPARDFWSVVAYDPQTRSMIQTDQPYPSKNSERNRDLVQNADGTTTLWFGPKAPSGHETNWIQTVPGKGWFVLLRLYGPLQPWFDRTWKPGEFERLD
jgi:hypothetical protein